MTITNDSHYGLLQSLGSALDDFKHAMTRNRHRWGESFTADAKLLMSCLANSRFYIRCDKAEPAPCPVAPVKFPLGTTVRYKPGSSYAYGGKTAIGTVAGFEVRYRIQRADGHVESFGRRAEHLVQCDPAAERREKIAELDKQINTLLQEIRRLQAES